MKNATVLCACIAICSSVRAEPIEWGVTEGGNGHWYDVVPFLASWEDCVNDSGQRVFNGILGHLATINSAGENTFVWQNLPADLRWLGASRGGSGWEWVTGEPFSYTHWSPGEPNNFGGNEYYLQFDHINTGDTWNDNSNFGHLSGSSYGYVIEFEPSYSDEDDDWIPAFLDNCTSSANVKQRDTDSDGIGNACDGDFSQDCEVNFVDLGIMKAFFFLSGDFATDMNADGATNFLDLAIFKESIFLPPGPSGVPHICDPEPPQDLETN